MIEKILSRSVRLMFVGSVAVGVGIPVQSVFAQEQTVQRVTVTGSSIKRSESETSLPISVISRDQIEKSGAVSIEDLLKRVSANSAAFSDTTQGAGYATSNANLRGMGANSTLILLNGRRLANHPFGNIGGTAAVDLNSIPFTAIDRIEVLRDGASAVYGSDAVGGVINFITRKDYKHGDVSIRYGNTQANIGGTEKGGSIAIGFGDLNEDKFNVLLTANVQKNSRLRAVDQALYNRGVTEIPGSSPPSSSAPFPGYIEGSIAPGSYPNANLGPNFSPCSGSAFPVNKGLTPNGMDRLGCRFVYAATLDNLPDQEKGDVYGRATFKASVDHTMFVEASYAQNHSIGRIAPTPIKYGFGPFHAEINDFYPVNFPVTSPFYPRALLASLGYPTPATGMVQVGLRAIPAGNRINDTTNSQARLVVGSTGIFAGWDYDAGLNISRAEGLLNYHGYVQEDRFLAGMATGLINPFGPSGAEGDALWKAAAMDGDMRKSSSTTTAIDVKGSKELMPMAGGSMAIAVGVDLRNEKADDKPLNADYAAGKHIGGEGSVPATNASRNLMAVFSELSIPFAKGWEATIAARYDHYSDFGHTVNPRIALRYQATPELMFRAGAGTGFRAPTLWDVNSPASYSNTADPITDPACPDPAELNGRCTTQWTIKQTAAPGLKPETSRQFNAGVVFAPSSKMSVTLDYWNIEKKDQIGVIAADVLMASSELLARFPNRIKRGPDGFMQYVETPVDNLGNLKTSGLDLDVRGRIGMASAGNLNLGLAGTYVHKYTAQKYAGGSYKEYVGTGGDGSQAPVPKWQHTASAEWQLNAMSVTLEHVYTQGWVEAADRVAASVDVAEPYTVKASSRYNLGASYKGMKDITLRVGVRNLLNTEPPYVASSSYGSHAAGYAASFTDPRGRFFYASLNYQFK